MKIQTKFAVSSFIVCVLLTVLVGGSLIVLAQAKKVAGERQRTAADLVRAVHYVRGNWHEVNDEINDLIRRGFNTQDFEQHRAAVARFVESLNKLEFLRPMAPELDMLHTGRNAVVELSEQIGTLLATGSPETPSIRSAIATALAETAHSIDDVIEEMSSGSSMRLRQWRTVRLQAWNRSKSSYRFRRSPS